MDNFEKLRKDLLLSVYKEHFEINEDYRKWKSQVKIFNKDIANKKLLLVSINKLIDSLNNNSFDVNSIQSDFYVDNLGVGDISQIEKKNYSYFDKELDTYYTAIYTVLDIKYEYKLQRPVLITDEYGVSVMIKNTTVSTNSSDGEIVKITILSPYEELFSQGLFKKEDIQKANKTHLDMPLQDILNLCLEEKRIIELEISYVESDLEIVNLELSQYKGINKLNDKVREAVVSIHQAKCFEDLKLIVRGRDDIKEGQIYKVRNGNDFLYNVVVNVDYYLYSNYGYYARTVKDYLSIQRHSSIRFIEFKMYKDLDKKEYQLKRTDVMYDHYFNKSCLMEGVSIEDVRYIIGHNGYYQELNIEVKEKEFQFDDEE